MILNFNKEVKELENKNEWNKVIELLESEWEKDKNNFNNFLCLGAEIWFILVFYERIKCRCNINILINKLKNITNYGFENFNNKKYFNGIFGYMISLFPYYFYDDSDYYGWKEKGINMIGKAYLKDKSNPFLSAIYFGSRNETEKRREACLIFTKNKNRFFSESEEVGSYFISVLSF